MKKYVISILMNVWIILFFILITPISIIFGKWIFAGIQKYITNMVGKICKNERINCPKIELIPYCVSNPAYIAYAIPANNVIYISLMYLPLIPFIKLVAKMSFTQTLKHEVGHLLQYSECNNSEYIEEALSVQNSFIVDNNNINYYQQMPMELDADAYALGKPLPFGSHLNAVIKQHEMFEKMN